MGTYNEGDAVARIWSRLRDHGNTNDQQLLNDSEVLLIGVRGAEPMYSRIQPSEQVADQPANGTHYLPLPAGYVEGSGTITEVETPPNEVPANVMDARDWYVGRDGTGVQRLVFTGTLPATGVVVRVSFTGVRKMAPVAANTTVLDSDFPAFCDLAASLCADSIAAKYARTSEPAFNADAVNFRTRSSEWQQIAKALWTSWERGMGYGSGGESGGGNMPPASAYANWDASASWGGAYVNHPRQGR
jgi:hypothetical protein